MIGRSFISFCYTLCMVSQMCSEMDRYPQAWHRSPHGSWSAIQEAAQCSGWSLAVKDAALFVLMSSGSPQEFQAKLQVCLPLPLTSSLVLVVTATGFYSPPHFLFLSPA